MIVESADRRGQGDLWAKTPIAGKASYWAGPDDERNCALDADTAVDIGISDVFATTCPQFSLLSDLPAGVEDDLGPVQSMGFVVPASSPESAAASPPATPVSSPATDRPGTLDRMYSSHSMTQPPSRAHACFAPACRASSEDGRKP